MLNVSDFISIGFTIANVVIAIGTTFVKQETQKIVKEHIGFVNESETKLQNLLGEQQYNDDVQIMKQAVKTFNKQLSLITLSDMETIAIAINDKVHLTKDETIKEIFNIISEFKKGGMQ